MSVLKFSPNSFLGKQELDRFKKFLDDDGFRKLFLNDMITFGLFNNSTVGAFDNFKVEQGTNAGTIKHAAGVAVDSNGELIIRSAIDNIALTDDNTWYWVKIKHTQTSVEQGTVDVAADGSLTGTGTLFTEILRGSPNNAVKIKFQGASLNTGEYEVLSVIDDTNAVLNGVLQVESGLQLIVVGAFDPDAVPTSGEKEIYQYDSTTFSFEVETVSETAPTLIDGEEFFIARVKNNSGTISINDVRSRYIARSKSDYQQVTLDTSANAMIGVESIKNDHQQTSRDRNIMYFAWAFRSSNWTFDPAINRVTLSDGQGGVFKTTTDFTDGDFDGWRLYTEDGSYTRVRTSSLSGSQINLDVDSLDFIKFSDSSQQLLVTPNVEGIVVKLIPDNTTYEDIALVNYYFPINTDVAKIPVVVFGNPTCSYVVKYQYKHGKEYSSTRTIPSDAVGYYSEVSFNDDGSLKSAPDRVRVPYTSNDTNGFIIFTLGSGSYYNLLSNLLAADAEGLNVTAFDNAAPVVSLDPGIDPFYQIYDHTSSSITLTTDHYIDLSTEDDSGNSIVNDGNSFTIDIRGTVTLDGNTLKVVTGYVNSGDTGTELFDFTQSILDFAVSGNVRVEFRYDETNAAWYVYQFLNTATPSGNAGGDLTGTYPNPTLGSDVVDGSNIADDSIDSEHYVNGSIDNAHLANDSVNGNKISDDSINSEHYVDGSIDNVHLANGTLDYTKTDGETIARVDESLQSDWDNLTESGIYYRFNITDSNDPGAGEWMIIVINTSSSNIRQIAMGIVTATTSAGFTHSRHYNGSVWSSWGQLITGDGP